MTQINQYFLAIVFALIFHPGRKKEEKELLLTSSGILQCCGALFPNIFPFMIRNIRILISD